MSTEGFAVGLKKWIIGGEDIDQSDYAAGELVVGFNQGVVNEGAGARFGEEPGLFEQGKMAGDFGRNVAGDGADVTITDRLTVAD